MSYSLREADLATAKRELERMIAAGLVTIGTPLFKPEALLRRNSRADGPKKRTPPPQNPPSPVPSSSAPGTLPIKSPQGDGAKVGPRKRRAATWTAEAKKLNAARIWEARRKNAKKDL